MTHKSCAGRWCKKTPAVCKMDTNSHMMCGKLSYKYLSLCCEDCCGEKCMIINLLNENILIGTSDGDAVHPEYTTHSGFSKHTSMFGIFNVLECKSYSTFFISVFYNITFTRFGLAWRPVIILSTWNIQTLVQHGSRCLAHWRALWAVQKLGGQEKGETPWPAHQMGSLKRVRWLWQLPALP